ncbi:MAG: hypothetical protein E7339_07450 [Clostridiales bacterium]|nr:hypothetical protein [Clostridiales bacterium]
MKKLRSSIVIILCVTFLVSAVSAIISGVLTAMAGTTTHDYRMDYKTLDYAKLDSVTRRDKEPDKSPQITVFTYGCGANLSHWSNNQAENPSDDYEFGYEKD